MGTWGSNLLENDTAADVVGFWNEFIEHGRQHDPAFWTAERILALFRQSYFRTGASRDATNREHASEILAVGALFVQHGLVLPTALAELVGKTANIQLQRAQLKEWGDDARARRRALEALLAAIGQEQVRLPKPADPVKAEIRQLRKWSKHLPRWVASVKQHNGDEEWARLEPPFLSELGRTFAARALHPDNDVRMQLISQRLLVMAFFFSWWLPISEEEAMALIRLAEKNGPAEFGPLFYHQF
jgi:hypothetical protein